MMLRLAACFHSVWAVHSMARLWISDRVMTCMSVKLHLRPTVAQVAQRILPSTVLVNNPIGIIILVIVVTRPAAPSSSAPALA